MEAITLTPRLGPIATFSIPPSVDSLLAAGDPIPPGPPQEEINEEEIAAMFSVKKKKKKDKDKEKALMPDTNEDDQEDTYDSMLSRLYGFLKKEKREQPPIRIKLPQLDRLGTKRTVYVNFRDSAAALRRAEDHVQQFMANELGAPTSIDKEGRLIMKGRFSSRAIESVVRTYVQQYVQCKNCTGLSTTLSKDQSTRLTMLTCGTCRASVSVAAISQAFHATMKGERKKAAAAAE